MFLKERFDILRHKEKEYDAKTSDYMFGYIYECFVKNDENLFFIMKYIGENIENLDSKFINILKKNTNEKIKRIMKEASAYPNGIEKQNYLNFEIRGISCDLDIYDVDSLYGVNSLNDFLLQNRERYKDSYERYIKNSKENGNDFCAEYLDKYIPLKNVFNIFYENYKRECRDMNFSVYDYKTSDDVKEKIRTLYNKEILDRYDLFKMNENHYIYNYEINYLKDDNMGNNYLITASSRETLEIIKKIKEEKFIEDISFQITNILSSSLGLEHKIRGICFDYNLSELHDVSHFYNVDEKDEELYVFVDKEKNKISLTFETLVPDLIMDKDGNVLTNLIHLEVIKDESNNNIISHIDHEYIVYSAEEYDARYNNNPKQRGRDKIKTFKIDNAKIPLNYTIDGAPILYCFLVSCLDNKELIDEYFNNVINRVNP